MAWVAGVGLLLERDDRLELGLLVLPARAQLRLLALQAVDLLPQRPQAHLAP